MRWSFGRLLAVALLVSVCGWHSANAQNLVNAQQYGRWNVTTTSDGGIITVCDVDGVCADVTGANALKVDGSAVTQPVSISQTTTNNDVDVVSLPAIPAGNNNIGDVDVVSFPDNEPFNVAQINGVAPSMGNGASGTGVLRVTIANDSTGIIDARQATAANLNIEAQGDTANAAPATGNPVRVGAYVEADAAQLDSTNQAEGDATNLKADIEGRLLVRDDHLNRFHCFVGTSTATTAQCRAAPGAGLSLYITDIYVSSDAVAAAANRIGFVMGTGANCGTGTANFAGNITYAINDGHTVNFRTPVKLTANNAACCVSSAAAAWSCHLGGYIAP